MSLFPVPRRLCALLLLMASLALCLLAAPDAHAGCYTFAYSGGTVSASPLPPGQSPPPFSSGEGYSGGDTVTAYYPTTAASVQVDASSPVTATLTWQPGQNQTMATDPPPTAAICLQTSNTSWSCTTQGTASGSGSVDCGLAPCSASNGQSNGTNYSGHGSASAGSLLTTFQVSCPAKASFSGSCGTGSHDSVTGSADVGYGAGAYPVFLNIGGKTLDSSGNWNILVGQQCTASLVVGPDFFGYNCPCNLSNFRWKVSGTTFESWGVASDANGQSHTVEVDAIPATNGTQWYWNDLQAATETVKCTFTVTPPAGDGSPFDMTVTAPKPISVQVPAWKATGTGGYMQVNNAQPNDTTHDLWAGPTSYERSNGAYPAGMNWRATLSTPTTPAFGTGSLELVQLVTPNNSYVTVANPTVTVPDPENNYSLSLDGSCPYGSGSEVPVPALTYQDNDAPSLPLDDSNLKLTANKGGSYSDYLMYQAPGSTQWVLLGTFSWSASGNATMPGNKDGSPITPGTNNWPSYTSTSVAGVTDGAGAVTPPGSNPPQTILPTPVPFTPASTPNTFPKWTHVDLGHAF